MGVQVVGMKEWTTEELIDEDMESDIVDLNPEEIIQFTVRISTRRPYQEDSVYWGPLNYYSSLSDEYEDCRC